MSYAVPIVVLPHGEGLPLPSFATAGSSGMDLRAAVDNPILLKPGGRVLVPTGLKFALRSGLEGQVRPRSGLAVRHGVTVLNAPGTIDSDYRGEVKVVLINHGAESFTIDRGDRIAQLVICEVAQVHWVDASELSESDRGHGGFGHTGRH